MKKMTKPSTKGTKKTTKRTFNNKEVKISPWLEDYLDCFTFQYRPVTEAFINRISTELVTWAKTDEKALKVRPFFSNKGIAQDTYNKWRKKYPTFTAAYNLALAIIGDRREHGAVERKLDGTVVTYMMHHYDPEWRAAREFHNALKKDAQGDNGGAINVYLEKFPSSDIVSEKVDNKPAKEKSKNPEQVALEASMRYKTNVKLNK